MTMTVKKVMKKKVLTIPLGTTVRDAVRVLVEHRISGAPVVDEANKVVGIISEKDLFHALYPTEEEFASQPELWSEDQAILHRADAALTQLIDGLMIRDLIAVTPDTSIIRVGALMLARGIHRVLVMDGGDLKGIVSRSDIYHGIFSRELHL